MYNKRKKKCVISCHPYNFNTYVAQTKPVIILFCIENVFDRAVETVLNVRQLAELRLTYLNRFYI